MFYIAHEPSWSQFAEYTFRGPFSRVSHVRSVVSSITRNAFRLCTDVFAAQDSVSQGAGHIECDFCEQTVRTRDGGKTDMAGIGSSPFDPQAPGGVARLDRHPVDRRLAEVSPFPRWWWALPITATAPTDRRRESLRRQAVLSQILGHGIPATQPSDLFVFAFRQDLIGVAESRPERSRAWGRVGRFGELWR